MQPSIETSMLLARLFAVAYLAIGVGFFFTPTSYKKMMDDFMGNQGTLFAMGMMTYVAGFFLVYYHNLWESSWRVLITLVAWAALLKGVSILAFPAHFVRMGKSFLKINNNLMVALILAVGALFAYLGFLI